MNKWIKNPQTLEDGYYWYRVSNIFLRDDYEVLRVCNGIIVDSQPIDSYGAVWEVYEHDNFKGEWWGPIIPPN